MSRTALRHRDFRLLWTGQSISLAGSAATRVVLPLVAVTTLHASAFTMGLLNAAAWLPWLAIGLPAGAWVDRLPRRPVLIASDLVSGLLLLGTAAAAWWQVLTMRQLIAVAVLSGTAGVFFAGAYSAYLPLVLPADALVDANAKLQLSESTADLAAPGLGGALAQAGGAAVGFLADGLSFLLSAVLLCRIRVAEGPADGPAVRGERRSLRREIGAGVGFLLRDPLLRTIALCDAGTNLFLSGTQVLVVVFLSRTVGLSGGTIGVLFGLVGLGGVAGAALAPRLSARYGTARSLLVCVLGGAPFGLLVPCTGRGPGLLAFLVGDSVLTAGVVAGNVIIVSFRQAYCPPAMLGRISSAIRFLMYGMIPVGSLLAGVLGTAFGTRAALWALYGAAGLCGLPLLRAPIRTLRMLPGPGSLRHGVSRAG